MSVLYCNPSENNVVHLTWLGSDGEILGESSHDFPRSEEILAAIDALTNGVAPDTIVCVNKAESFTLVRILATIYNSFRVAQGTRLIALEEPLPDGAMAVQCASPEVAMIVPQYSRLPNIS